MSESNERARIEQLKNELYSRQYEDKEVVASVPEREYEAPKEWAPPPTEEEYAQDGKRRMSMHKKFLIGSIMFFLLAAVVAVYEFMGGNILSPDKVQVSINGPVSVAGGQDVPLTVSITNTNSAAVEGATLHVEYPNGSYETFNATDQLTHAAISVGSVDSGTTVNEALHFVVFGQQDTKKVVKASLEFRFADSSVTLSKDVSYTLNITSAPLDLSVDMPSDTTSGQNMQFTVTVQSNTDKVMKGILMQVDLPPGFTFKNANPAPSSKNATWKLGDIAPGETKTITISGVVTGEHESQDTFDIRIGKENSSDPTSIQAVYNSMEKTTIIKDSFLALNVLMGGKENASYIVGSGRSVRVDIVWKNVLPVKIENAEIDVKLNGKALNRFSVIVGKDGFYRSVDNTLVWNQRTSPNLASIEPGQSGQVSFSLASIPLDVGSGNIVQNPNIGFTVGAQGLATTESGGVKSVKTGEISGAIKVDTDLHLTGQVLYFAGPFTNIGPIPPVAEKRTTYTLKLTAVNTSNAARDAHVSFTLPTYVDWVGAASGNEKVSYNQIGGQVDWDIGDVPAGAGITGPAREVSMQVGFTPSITQIRSSPALTSSILLTATDAYTGTSINETLRPLTIDLSTDPSAPQGSGFVAQ